MPLIERKGGKGGSVLMETVLALPVLFLFIVGILQFAHIWMAKQMTAYAAYTAARAMMVVPPVEQQAAADNAARMVLSWISLADGGDGSSEAKVTVPGWGQILGSGSVLRDWGAGGRVRVEVTNGGGFVRARVRFRFPLMMPGMAVNRIIASAATDSYVLPESSGDIWEDWSNAAGNPSSIDGWPYIELKEDCILPMPYSTADFPSGAFRGASLTGGR